MNDDNLNVFVLRVKTPFDPFCSRVPAGVSTTWNKVGLERLEFFNLFLTWLVHDGVRPQRGEPLDHIGFR